VVEPELVCVLLIPRGRASRVNHVGKLILKYEREESNHINTDYLKDAEVEVGDRETGSLWHLSSSNGSTRRHDVVGFLRFDHPTVLRFLLKECAGMLCCSLRVIVLLDMNLHFSTTTNLHPM
jgi:hypothetical protein